MPDDTYLTLVTLRAVRDYAETPIPDDILNRVLEAGRSSGSSRNTQPWTFFVARTREKVNRMGQTVYAPENLERCRAAIAIASPKGGFDIGRCAERMMIVAWSFGVGSCPNGIKDQEALSGLLGLSEGSTVTTILSFGYPLHGRRASSADDVLARMDRRRLGDVVRDLD